MFFAVVMVKAHAVIIFIYFFWHKFKSFYDKKYILTKYFISYQLFHKKQSSNSFLIAVFVITNKQFYY